MLQQYDGCENMFLKIYHSTDAHINAVISHLFYRTFVKMLPDYQIGSKPINSIEHLLRTWVGGHSSRISNQEDMELHPDPELCLVHVLEILDWLLEEVQLSPGTNPYYTDKCFLSRIQCVNAQQVRRGFQHTKHRPYDMVMAVFAAANCMAGSEEEHGRLKVHFEKFAKMYLFQCGVFDYLPQDVYHDVDTSDPSAKPIETCFNLFRLLLEQFSTRQEYAVSSTQLTLHDVIIVLDKLIKKDGELNMFRLDSETVKHKSLHQPLDMLIAIIAAAHFLPKTELDNDEEKLKTYYKQIAPIYLLESGNFDYVKKDIYSHEAE